MSALLADLTTRGVRLSLNDGRLRIEAPKGVLTPELRSALTEHKLELIAFLQTHPANERKRPAPQPPDEPPLAAPEVESPPSRSTIPRTEIDTFTSLLDLAEISRCPVVHLFDLPFPPVLVCAFERGGDDSTLTFDFRRLRSRKAHGRPVFDADETGELIDALERQWPADLKDYCKHKRRDPHWRLRLKGIARAMSTRMLLADFLKRLGLKLCVIEIRPT